MYLENIRLFNFRNFSEEQVSFCPGLNFIVGKNGQGKTNLVEAIHFLSWGRSFRSSKAQDLVRWGEENASVFALMKDLVSDKEIGISIEGRAKNAFINSNKTNSITDFLGTLVCVGFSPTDIALVKGAPQLRRRFVDRYLSELHSTYLSNLLSYHKALKNKNALLKTNEPSGAEVQTWNAILVETAYIIINFRLKFLAELQTRANFFHNQYSLADGQLELDLETNLFQTVDTLSKEAIAKKYEENIERELLNRSAIIGPHRDDVLIKFAGSDARAFASQGQARSVVLSLTLAVIDLIESRTDESPVVLLDDVGSELDSDRSRAFFDIILANERQIFITGTDLSIKNITPSADSLLLEIDSGKVKVAERETI